MGPWAHQVMRCKGPPPGGERGPQKVGCAAQACGRAHERRPNDAEAMSGRAQKDQGESGVAGLAASCAAGVAAAHLYVGQMHACLAY